MRTATKTFNVYRYNELSEKAKEKVKKWYLDDDDRSWFLEQEYLLDLASLFPHSDLKVQFSLCSCQGDGVNIYGQLSIKDALRIMNSDKHIKSTIADTDFEYLVMVKNCPIKNYPKALRDGHATLPYNYQYTYSLADQITVSDDTIYELGGSGNLKDADDVLILKLEAALSAIFRALSKAYEAYGYTYLYEISEQELSELCEVNEWEFLEDGTLFH